MPAVIDYYYTPISGFAYLGEPRLRALAAEAGATIFYRPVDIARVFAAAETTPPARQSAARLSYRREDMARRAAAAGLPLNPEPAFWPVDPGLAARVIAAAALGDADPGVVSFALLKAVWAEDRNLADPQQVAAVLGAAGVGVDLLDAAGRPEAAAAVAANTEAAIAAGVFGSPTYVVAGARFWGQDRLDDLARALAAGLA
ncbi:MAG: 2-hydroxychromene-2-carboxylate isomerase [Rhodobacteraceae bacterium]|nr:MAG: 2-hydroxychromene-2-carboxylate isomerase [Paracoccaceae bacterium]